MDKYKWLSLQCNKQVNGACYSLTCLIRGGWRKDKVDYDLATCTPSEILKELEKKSAHLDSTEE